MIYIDFFKKRKSLDVEFVINKEKNLVIDFTSLNQENEYSLKKCKILIVEDDKNISEIIYQYLSNSGFKNFIRASDGKIGLEAASEYLPDIIICDYNMPNMKGDQFHDELSDNPKFKKIPFIFLSAVSDKRLINERRVRGADAYLKKPIDEKELLINVEQYVSKYFDYLKLSEIPLLKSIDFLK